MAKTRSSGVMAFLFIASLALSGCEGFQGDSDVDTAPQGDDVGKSPGLLTGKKGALIFETNPWQGPSPYGDSAE